MCFNLFKKYHIFYGKHLSSDNNTFLIRIFAFWNVARTRDALSVDYKKRKSSSEHAQRVCRKNLS